MENRGKFKIHTIIVLFKTQSVETEPKPEENETKDENTAMLPQKGPKESEETAKLGTVSKYVYWGYIKAGANWCSGFVLIITTILTHGCFSLSDMWIRKWTNTEDLKLQDFHHHASNRYYS